MEYCFSMAFVWEYYSYVYMSRQNIFGSAKFSSTNSLIFVLVHLFCFLHWEFYIPWQDLHDVFSIFFLLPPSSLQSLIHFICVLGEFCKFFLLHYLIFCNILLQSPSIACKSGSHVFQIQAIFLYFRLITSLSNT